MKEIEMCMSGFAAFRRYGAYREKYIVYKDMEVDIEKLTPTARAIAESIFTTDGKDDASKIRVYGCTRRELAIKDGVEKEEIEKGVRVFGLEFMDRPVSTIWGFDFIKWYETPEQYFERHAKEIKQNGWLKMESLIKGDIFTIPD